MHGELVEQRGGGVVEQVGVVDQQGAYAGQVVQRAVQGGGRGQQRGEGGEREVPALRRPGDAGAVGAAYGLGDESGLAPARRTRHHDAAPGAPQGVAYLLELVLPPGERPGPARRRLRRVRLPRAGLLHPDGALS